MIEPLKAISIRQPWAWSIVAADKPLENRIDTSQVLHACRKMRNGTWVAIHASLKPPTIDEWTRARDLAAAGRYEMPPIAALPYGMITGVARVYGVVRSRREAALIVGERGARWFTGPAAIVLIDRTPLPRPVFARGMLHLWTVAPLAADEVRGQLGGLLDG